jgi:hypothetical protein
MNMTHTCKNVIIMWSMRTYYHFCLVNVANFESREVNKCNWYYYQPARSMQSMQCLMYAAIHYPMELICCIRTNG